MKDGKLVGFNTDINGFLYPLLSLKEKTKLSNALVIGYGGAAKGVVYALANPLEFEKIVVAGHNQERLEKAQRRMSNIVRVDQLDTVTFDELVSFDTSNIDLIVNCTPLGGSLYQNDSPFPELFDWPKERIYYDLNYNRDNLIIATARQDGLDTIDGSAMLVAQALKSLEHWTGQAIPFEPVYQAVFGEGKQ
jgi:shikimate dehydrogenase